MPKKRTNMHKIKDLLRLKFEAGLSHRAIAACLKMGVATVSEIASRHKSSGLGWPLPDDLTEQQLSAALYPTLPQPQNKRLPDFRQIHTELRRKGMTKQLLWQEYREQQPETAYGYTRFCTLYRSWVTLQKRSMRQHHTAGDKLFIDYCGPTVPVVHPDTGEVRKAQIFVATFGASNYTYIEACRGQDSESWLTAHVNAFEFFEGVPRLLVPDNLRAAVSKADRYEPQLNDNYARLARHYNTAVMPARPYKPKDKSKAENAVLIVERWILMRLRHRTFHSFTELNRALRELLDELNNRPQRVLPGSRSELFAQLDKPALRPLPGYRYEYVDSHQAKVGPDYHILYRKHAYSVPHQLVGERLQLEATARLVRIYHHGELIAQHPRATHAGGFTTTAEHMPQNHQHQRWSPERLLNWGASIGPGTREVVQWQLARRAHPEQAYRSCLSLLALHKTYGEERLEAACRKALLMDRPHRETILNLLKNNKEQEPQAQPCEELPLQHTNIRGDGYFN